MNEPNTPNFSLVLACYNEMAVLETSLEEIRNVLDNTRLTYEIIFVDDFSTDGTRERLEGIVRDGRYENVRLLLHEKNLGRGRAVSDGIRSASGEVAGFIDIDLETHARYIPELVRKVKDGADIALALRIYKFQFSSFGRVLLTEGYRFLVRALLRTPPMDTESGCKFFNRKTILGVLDEVADPHWFWDTELMVRSHLRGLKIVTVPTLFIRRHDKKSTVKIFSDTIDYMSKLWKFRKVVNQIREAQGNNR